MSFSRGLVPKASLKVVSYLQSPFYDNFMKFTDKNDAHSIKQIITQGQLPPDALVNGNTLSSHSLLALKLEICEVLLVAGADAHISHLSAHS